MDTSQILQEVDIELIGKQSPTLGVFDSLALSARYNFTWEEYQLGAAFFALNEQALPEVIKTILHETTHLYQMLSTPYGYYYHLVRSFQSNQAVVLWRILQKKGTTKHPLMTAIARCRPREAFPDLWFNLYLWYLAEIVLLYMEGNKDIYLRQRLNNPLFKGKPVVQCFAELEACLAALLAATGRNCDYVGHNLFIEGSRDEEMAMTALKATGDFDVLSILESWAKTSEFWNSEIEGSSYSKYLFPSPLSIEQSRYYYLIEHAKPSIKTTDHRRFVWTYAALCELSLFGPILPQHSKLRSGKTTLAEIHPLSRFLSFLRTAAEIEPVRNLDSDYRRFIEEVCSAKAWPSPLAMNDGVAFHYPPQDLRSDLYHRAQALRARVPSAFIDLSCWYTPKNDFTKELTYYFVHPVMEFSDKVLFHKDKTVVAFFITQYAVNAYLRKFLLSDDLTVTLPFRSNSAARELCQDVLAYYLAAVGIGDRTIVVQ
jgi:hypothetical protein